MKSVYKSCTRCWEPPASNAPSMKVISWAAGALTENLRRSHMIMNVQPSQGISTPVFTKKLLLLQVASNMSHPETDVLCGKHACGQFCPLSQLAASKQAYFQSIGSLYTS